MAVAYLLLHRERAAGLGTTVCKSKTSHAAPAFLQFLKVVFPIWHGARYQCEKKTKHALQRVLKQCNITLKADQLQTAATAPGGLPAPSLLVTSK